MKVYQAGLLLCIASFGMGWVLGFDFGKQDTIYPQEVLQATSNCKQGDWVKIDQTTIYCADGAEYKRGE